MKSFCGLCLLQGVGLILLVGFCFSVAADVKINPYNSIAVRNPFALKDPPPPQTNEVVAPPPPPPPAATVELTGIVSILGKNPRALLEIIPGPGKPMAKPILGEGEKFESVEIVAININKNEVTVKNGQLVTNMTFKVVKSSTPPPPPAGTTPGLPNPLTPPIHQSNPQAQQSAYNSGGRNNVMVGGGAPTTPAANALNNNAAAAANGYNSPVIAPNANDPNFRSIPSRNIRTTAPQANAPVSLEEHYIMTEMNRNVHGLPLPPTPLNPNPVYPPRGNNQGNNFQPGVNFPPVPGGGNPQQ